MLRRRRSPRVISSIRCASEQSYDYSYGPLLTEPSRSIVACSPSIPNHQHIALGQRKGGLNTLLNINDAASILYSAAEVKTALRR
jgi:hypothetical protein